MSGGRKVLLVIVALVVLARFLPVTRDEFSWWWVQSCNHSDDYLDYLSAWPEGRHATEARLFYQERHWAESKRARIRQAYAMASQANAKTEAAYRREQQMRRDDFFWKRASTANTPASYNDYLRQFPQGCHAAEARRKIPAFSHPAAGSNTSNPPMSR